jgi:ABC-type enterochelin transport system ATPase subunit
LGKHVVVDSVSLQVRRGDFTGFIGHNGAGKTTATPPASTDTHDEPLRELRYERNPELVQDPGAAEPVWSAD